MYNINYDKVNLLSDSKFKMRSLSDYLDSRTSQFSKVYETILYAAEHYDTGNDYLDTLYLDEFMSIQGYINDFSLDSYITLSKGQIRIRDLIIQLQQNLKNAEIQEEFTGVFEQNFQLSLPSGSISDYFLSWDDICNELKTALYSCQSMTAAIKAWNIGNTISDKMATFNEIISSAVAEVNLFPEVRAFLSNSLLTSISDNDFLNNLFSSINIKALAEQEEGDIILPEQCEFTDYTGAVPVTGFSIPIIGPIVAIAQVAWSGVKSLWNGLNKLFNSAFDKVSSKFVSAGNALFNPFDIYEINEKGNHTVDKFYRRYFNENGYKINPIGPSNNNQAENTDIANTLNNFILPKINDKWIKYETIFNEVLFRFNNGSAIGYSSHVSIDISDFDRRIKFKPIDRTHGLRILEILLNPENLFPDWLDRAVKYNDTALISRDYTFQRAIDYINENINSLYPSGVPTSIDDNDNSILSEADLAIGFILSQICWACLTTLANPTNYAVTWEFSSISSIINYIENAGRIGNDEWVQLLSGYVNGSFENSFKIGSLNISPTDVIPGIISSMIDWILASMIYRYYFPLEFSFLSYRNNVEAWSLSSYSVKTDTENSHIANNILWGLIIVVAITVTAIALGSKIRKSRRQLRNARTQDYYRIIGKMQRGESLTTAETKNFSWLTKKVAITSGLSSGIASIDNSGLNDNVLDSTKSIYKAIV